MAKQNEISKPSGGLVAITVTCRGVTPLLMNRIPPETLEQVRTKAKKPKTAQRPAVPRDEAIPKLYVTEEGNPYIPTENLLSCLVAAGQSVRLDGKRQVSTAKSTVLPAFLSLEERFLPLFVHGSGAVPDWEVDLRAGRNPNGGELVCLVRPRFDEWAFRVTATVDLDEVGLNIARDLFDIAGKRVGLGDFRPSRKGMYGKFVVVGWEENHPVAQAAE
jgi:hypothetical protein